MQPGDDPGRLEIRLIPAGVAVLVAVAAIIIGFATGFWLLFRVAYVVVIALPLLYLWSRSMGESLVSFRARR